MTLGGRAILYDGERVLLVRHGYMPGWQFPGGGIEAGEAIEVGAIREVLEETGYKVTGNAELCGIYLNAEVSRRDHVALFVCREFECARPFEAGFEIAACSWFALDNLPDDLSAATARRIAEVFEGKPKSGTW